jgi:hypothetical protein
VSARPNRSQWRHRDGDTNFESPIDMRRVELGPSGEDPFAELRRVDGPAALAHLSPRAVDHGARRVVPGRCDRSFRCRAHRTAASQPAIALGACWMDARAERPEHIRPHSTRHLNRNFDKPSRDAERCRSRSDARPITLRRSVLSCHAAPSTTTTLPSAEIAPSTSSVMKCSRVSCSSQSPLARA